MQEKPVLTNYLRRLTRLSGNNRSLLLLRLSKMQMIDWQQLSHLQGKSAAALLENILSLRRTVICPVNDSRMEAVNETSFRLKNLLRTVNQIETEQGSQDLHLAWPMAEGKFNDGTPVRCGLLYIPVKLEMVANQWIITPNADREITFNRTFLLAYAHYNGLKPVPELMEYSFNDSINDINIFLSALYDLLKDKIEVNFNSDNFTGSLRNFQEYRKENFLDLQEAGRIKLFPEAVLGIFPQTGSQLEPDYEALMELESITTPGDFFSMGELKHSLLEEDLVTPLAMDIWQEDAIRKVRMGNSLVVQGPPGTGKSQFISNLMADAIANNKRVLLVCQKRAALDVVYQRLSSLNLSDFLGLVHDFQSDRNALYRRLANQINQVETYKTVNQSAQVITIERRFVQVCRRMEELAARLEAFRLALYDDRQAGVSVHELYLLPAIPEKIRIPEITTVSWLNRIDLGAKLDRIQVLDRLIHPTHPWLNRKTFASRSGKHKAGLKELLENIPIQLSKWNARTQPVHHNVLIDTIWRAENYSTYLQLLRELINTPTRYAYFDRLRMDLVAGSLVEKLETLKTEIISCFDASGIDAHLPVDSLASHLAVISHYQLLKFHSIAWWWHRFTSGTWKIFKALCANYPQEAAAEFSEKELSRIKNRIRLEALLKEVAQFGWTTPNPAGLEKDRLITWLDDLIASVKAKLVLDEFKHFSGTQNWFRDYQYWSTSLTIVTEVYTDIKAQLSTWTTELHHQQIHQLVVKPAQVGEFIDTLQNDFDKLIALDQQLEQLTPSELKLVAELSKLETDKKWSEVYYFNLAQEWIHQLEEYSPILRSASDTTLHHDELEYQALVKEKALLAQSIIGIKVREQVYEDLEFNRLNNLLTYRDLQHQVSKKRQVWPIRKLMANYMDEIFKLIPCWLASPETVSAIFPLQEMFDLVIFDEASQCFAEYGLPALHRGKQAVIAGDHQQLRPSGLYQVRWNEESEVEDDEVESLLELASRYLPTTRLQGHYRSRFPELIGFSNSHFYEGKLQMLPYAEAMNQKPAISYLKVSGEWKNGVNELEADTITALLAERSLDKPEYTFGIITFNIHQQNLILDKLESAGLTRQGLFVKNIENVQGDECDVVIFSMGYSPDKTGRVPLQFGSLNQQGGINRLNVAVSRARLQMIVVTSMEPEQLQLETSTSGGPALLKSWLYYARSVSKGELPIEISERKIPEGPYLSERLKSDPRGVSISGPLTPAADAWIKVGTKFTTAILTDDEELRSAIHMKHPLVYTPLMLESHQWKWKRFYSRMYWSNSTQLFEAVQKG